MDAQDDGPAASRREAWLLAAFLVVALVASVAAMACLFRKWGIAKDQPEIAFVYMSIASGAAGAALQALMSLADYIGNRQLKQSWLPYLYFRPFVGGTLALAIYVLFHAGMGTTEIKQSAGPSAVAAIAMLVGLFSRQALDKLKEVTDVVFRATTPPRADGLVPGIALPKIDSLNPSAIPRNSNLLDLKILGSGFGSAPKVTLKDGAQETQLTTQVIPGGLHAQVPAGTLAAPKSLSISVADAAGKLSNAATLTVT